MKKIYYHIVDSPDAWIHETKVTMDTLDTFFNEFPTPSSTLEELKPLDPLSIDYLTASPDTSGTRNELSPISSTSPNQYKGAITNSNTFIGCGSVSEQVSTTTSPISSSNLTQVKQEPPSYNIPNNIDDIASILAPSINESPTLVGGIGLPDSLSFSPDLDFEAWIESLNPVKSEPGDGFIHSTVSPPPDHAPTQVQQPSTTTNIISTTLDYEQLQSQTQLSSSTPMLHSLLNNDTVNTNYMTSLNDNYQKTEISMPILQACLTQGMKELGSTTGGNNFTSSTTGILKADPMFNRSTYFSSNKDCVPHSTDPTTYAVTTTDDLLITKYDSRAYLDKTQLASPESTDLSSTKLGHDFGDIKPKNRSRMKNPKPPVRPEGSKDKPVHYCNICHRGFINKSNIKVHLRTHTGEKPFKCETCNKPFRQKAHLLKHYQIHRRDTLSSIDAQYAPH